MPKFKSKNKDCKLIVKVRLSSNEKINERELDFFNRKYIRGLMKAKAVKKFGLDMIEYTGPIGISLFDRLKQPISKYDFLFIMEQIVDIVQKLQSNALSINKIIWDIHQVFINETTRELQFLYVPLENPSNNAGVMEFVDNVIYSTHPSLDPNTDFISQFVYFLNGLNQFEPEVIEKYILKEDRTVVNTIKKHVAGQSGFMTDKQKDYYDHYNSDEDKTCLLEEEATGLLEEEEETCILMEDEEGTALLQEDCRVHFPTLHRIQTEEDIRINKPVFRIGKERSYADYFVSNNNAVSRSHADIITRGQKYYVIDLNSKNKTYVNGQPIPIQQEIEISNGDCLRLANEEFVFYT